MNKSTRMIAQLPHTPFTTKVKHFHGLPPKVTGQQDERRLLPPPAFLLLEQRTEGVFLFRYGSQGQCVGDTWHMSVQDAMDQAAFEYPDTALDWQDIPAEVADAVHFGIQRIGSLPEEA